MGKYRYFPGQGSLNLKQIINFLLQYMSNIKRLWNIDFGILEKNILSKFFPNVKTDQV